MARNKASPKDKDIKKEVKRLTAIFAELEENKIKASVSLIEEAAFMRVTLGELKEDVNLNGVIDEMEQGDYSILRESPAMKSYNTTIQRYTMVMKELLSMLPAGIEVPPDDGFDKYVNSK